MAVAVMQRYEMKYLMNRIQTDYLCREMEKYMRADEYGRTTVASLYYDTPDFRLIRSSLEKPCYKEKIRLRSYGIATSDSPVFLELKRKYEGIVYKRRIQTTIIQAGRFFEGEELNSEDMQIRNEITFFRDYYRELIPTCLVICDRTAYFEPGGDLRMTIDYGPRYRTDRLTLTEPMYGLPLLDDGWSILEIKVQEAIPCWLSAILSKGRIFKNSFSKYGEAYRQKHTEAVDCTKQYISPLILNVA